MMGGDKYALKVMLFMTVLLTCGCTSPSNLSDRFPVFAVVSPIDVYKLNSIPEKKLCTMSDPEVSKVFIAMLLDKYSKGWRKAPHVSLAPSYRIVSGNTEILLLKRGIVISTTNSENKEIVMVHDLHEGEVEVLVNAACESYD